jgi:hypothetical protein
MEAVIDLIKLSRAGRAIKTDTTVNDNPEHPYRQIGAALQATPIIRRMIEQGTAEFNTKGRSSVGGAILNALTLGFELAEKYHGSDADPTDRTTPMPPLPVFEADQVPEPVRRMATRLAEEMKVPFDLPVMALVSAFARAAGPVPAHDIPAETASIVRSAAGLVHAMEIVEESLLQGWREWAASPEEAAGKILEVTDLVMGRQAAAGRGEGV